MDTEPGERSEVVEEESDEIAEVLRACEETLSVLKENHRLVQDSGKAFAELASKMRAEIERRSGAERRTGTRDDTDRRRT
jgi:hypothetical protein